MRSGRKRVSSAAGAQDRERDRQVAEEPAAEGQTRVAGDLDGRNQGRRRAGVRRLHRELHAQIPKAADCLGKDRDTLLAFYDFPAEHWKHLRTTNPIESTFATVRHRTIRSKGCLSNRTALAMVFKLLEAAQKSWRRLDGHNQLPKPGVVVSSLATTANISSPYVDIRTGTQGRGNAWGNGKHPAHTPDRSPMSVSPRPETTHP